MPLQFDNEGNTAVDQIKHLGKRRHVIGSATDLQRSRFRQCQIADVAFATGETLQFIVVKHDNTAIAGEMNIAFDRETRFGRCFER